MLKRNLLKLAFLLIALLALGLLCHKGGKIDQELAESLVINEIMASNITGLMAENDSLYDWIEVKNISKETINLHDYFIAIEKEKHKSKDSLNTISTNKWRFPEIELQAGKTALVFASKREGKETDKELHADFKLPKSKGAVQLLSRRGTVLSELKYERLLSDQCLRRLEDGSYQKSTYQTPGFENNEQGYEQYCSLIEKQRKSPLLIWEAHTKSTKSTNAWVSIKNISNSPINLRDYSLSSDTYKKEDSWPLPSKELGPGEICKIVCRKRNIDFKSSRSVALLKGGKFLDGVCCLQAPFGVSLGRVEGKNGFFFLPQEEGGGHYRFISPAPIFDQKPGIYDNKRKLEIRLKTSGQRVHYTLDGSLPTLSSPIYSKPIKLDSSTVIRAFCEGDSLRMRSNIATATYFLNERHSLAVVNLSLPEDVLFNPEYGIYELGPSGRGTEYPHKEANFWKPGYKAAHVEFYDSTSSFSLDCGLSIFGGFSRALSKKSFKLKFDDFFGENQLYFDVFKEGSAEEFRHLVLRSGSQDMQGVMCRDEFFTSLLKEHSPTLLIQRYRPVALYINAKYFGLYYIREKIDKYFAAQRLGTSTDSINIIMSLTYNEEGPKTYYQEMLNYVRSHNLAGDKEYRYMETLVDIDGLIDQKIGEIYSGNNDVGNIRYIRSLDENSDKKWHYVFYDLDLSWTTFSPASHYLRQKDGVEAHNVVVDKMLANKKFRQRFLERVSLHMHKTFAPKHATALFNSIVSQIRPEMKRNCKRWPALCSYETWERNCVSFQKKFNTRPKEVLNDLRQELKITPEEDKKYFGDLGF